MKNICFFFTVFRDLYSEWRVTIEAFFIKLRFFIVFCYIFYARYRLLATPENEFGRNVN